MKGFDPKFSDFPDYIIGITKEIWEDRQIDRLHTYYSDNIVVRSPSSIVVGNQNVIGATMATLAEFPDRRLLGEDVIWCGTPDEGMLSSHRIISTATHSGDGVYGEASGKKLQYRIIADCFAICNQICDEWLIRDQGAIVRQIGLTPENYSRAQILKEGGPEKCVRPFTPKVDVAGPYKGTGNDNDWGKKYADILTRIMNADMAVLRKEYDRAVVAELPGLVTGFSHDALDRFWMGIRSSFPNAKFSLVHVMGMEEPLMSPRAAVRWSLEGLHDGWGSFGTPSHAHVYIMGISHVEFGPRGIRREFTVFDETAVWKQILLHKGEF